MRRIRLQDRAQVRFVAHGVRGSRDWRRIEPMSCSRRPLCQRAWRGRVIAHSYRTNAANVLAGLVLTTLNRSMRLTCFTMSALALVWGKVKRTGQNPSNFLPAVATAAATIAVITTETRFAWCVLVYLDVPALELGIIELRDRLGSF